MSINLNVNPYYDDFDENKGYHQILFKPGVSVQARELTQLQTIIKNQIAKFGDHVFKQGSIVIPGNSILETAHTVSLTSTSAFAGNVFNLGDEIEGVTSGVRAVVKKYIPKANNALLFVAYTRGGTAGKNTFDPNETVFKIAETGVRFNTAASNHIGIGSLFNLNEGVFYVNGNFVKTQTQSIVVSENSSEPSALIGLTIKEDIVNWVDDESILDNARGSSNFAAPGADRYSIELKLATMPLGSQMNTDFIHLMTVENGVIQYHSRFTKYSELDNYLARRTFDESGNYIVNGLSVSVIEDLRTPGGTGRSITGNPDFINYVVSPGKAYIRGFETEFLAPVNVPAPKARTAITKDNMAVRANHGSYIFVSNVLGLPSLGSHEQITFRSSVGGASIGTARVYDIDYVTGSGTGSIFKLYLYDVQFDNTNIDIFDCSQIVYGGGLTANTVFRLQYERITGTDYAPGAVVSHNGNAIGNTVTVLSTESTLYMTKSIAGKLPIRAGSNITGVASLTHRIADITGLEKQGTSVLLAKIPVGTIKTIRNQAGNPNNSFVTREQFQIVTNGSGAGSFVLSSGNIVSIESSSFHVFTATGIAPIGIFSLNSNGTTVSITGGAVSTTYFCYADVQRTNQIEATKTLQTRTETLSWAQTVNLDRADIYEIVAITSNTHGDVRASFELDTGQRDTHYQNGRLLSKTNTNLGTLTIQYRFFQHSATGDYFTVDSYRNSGLGTDFYTKINKYISKNENRTYYLKDYIDFRKIRTASSRLIANGTSFRFSIQHFLPRIDVICANKENTIYVKTGIPAEIPVKPPISDNEIEIAGAFVNAYTPNVRSVRLRQAGNTRVTMAGANALQRRVSNLEKFSQLSALEKNLLDMEIVDPVTGLNRYKSGYLVDNFRNPAAVAAIADESFAVQYERGTVKPKSYVHEVSYNLNSTSSQHFQVTGKAATLPYTTKPLVNQPLSTQVVNLNPYLVTSWVGNMVMTPDSDNWVELVDLPAIINNVTNTVTIHRILPPPPPPIVVPPPPVIQPAPPVVVPPPVVIDNWGGDSGGDGGWDNNNTNTGFDDGWGDFGNAGFDDGWGDFGNDSGGGGDGGKIICTKLYELGYLPGRVYLADQEFGRILSITDPQLIHGYHYWAKMVVNWMEGTGEKVLPIYDDKFKEQRSKLAIFLARKIATPWAEHMYHLMGGTPRDNKLGSHIMKVGAKISRLFGNKYKEPGLFTAVGSVAVFFGIYAYIEVYNLFKKLYDRTYYSYHN